MNDAEKAYQYFVIAIPENEEQAKAYFWARKALRPTLTPPTEWVSIEDRLPDTDGAYLVYAPTYTGGSSSSLDCIGGIMFSRFKHEKWSIESGYYKRPNCVTHWMPIPAPPGKDNNVPTKAQNEPLSIEQLRQMDGEPVVHGKWILKREPDGTPCGN